MKKNTIQEGLLLLTGLIVTAGLNAQSEVQVKIIHDGKVIKDTTYMVEDETSTKMAAKMLDIALGKELDEKGSNVYAFRSKDGKSYEFRTGDDSIHKSYEHSYYSSEDDNAENITVIVDEDGKKVIRKEKTVKKENAPEPKTEVIIVKKDQKSAEKNDDIEWIEKGNHKVLIIDNDGKKKALKIIKEKGDSENSEYITEDGKKIIIRQSEKGEEKEIKVEIIEKEENKDKKRKEEKR